MKAILALRASPRRRMRRVHDRLPLERARREDPTLRVAVEVRHRFIEQQDAALGRCGGGQ